MLTAAATSLAGTGLEAGAVERYIRERIHSVPGTDRHEQAFSVLLTGSRATGKHTPSSDVDIDVLCPRAVYDRVQPACRQAGLIRSVRTFFSNEPETDRSYFPEPAGAPHFSLIPMEDVAAQLARHEDVPMWIWAHARILTDPGGQARRLIQAHRTYPPDVLARKLKYHYLLELYWSIEVFPHHHTREDQLLAAATALLNSLNEQVRLFYLVEGKPFPYAEALTRHAEDTRLGRRFLPLLTEMTERIVGAAGDGAPAWQRLDGVFEELHCSDLSSVAKEYWQALDEAVVTAGIDREWVQAGLDNMDELILGDLGPPP